MRSARSFFRATVTRRWPSPVQAPRLSDRHREQLHQRQSPTSVAEDYHAGREVVPLLQCVRRGAFAGSLGGGPRRVHHVVLQQQA